MPCGVILNWSRLTRMFMDLLLRGARTIPAPPDVQLGSCWKSFYRDGPQGFRCRSGAMGFGFGLLIASGFGILNASSGLHYFVHEHSPPLRIDIWIAHSP